MELSEQQPLCRLMCNNDVTLLFLCRLLSFPTNLINASDTRRGIAKAFAMWSYVSPFSFREVPADQEADMKIGGYRVPLSLSLSLSAELSSPRTNSPILPSVYSNVIHKL